MNPTLSVKELFPELDDHELDGYLDSMNRHVGHLSDLARSEATVELPATLAMGARTTEHGPFQRLLRGIAAGTTPVTSWGVADPQLAAAASVAYADIVDATLNDLAVRPLLGLLARDREAGVLRGDDSHERYHNFQEQLAAEPTRFVDEYPQAWRSISRRCEGARSYLDEAIRRIHADRTLLHRELGIDADDPVVAIEPRGDAHNGGRRVAIVRLASGASFAYKPRPVDGEWAYRELVEQLRPLGLGCSSARTVRCAGYGYVEFLTEVDPPQSVVLARQTGRLGALLYALNCRDVHFENIIVTQDGPVPVDLESILHPHRLGSSGAACPPVDAHQLLDSSVHGVGVLPLVVSRTGEDTGYYDVGFLGRGRVVGGGAFRRYSVVDPYTDQMRCVFTKPGVVTENQDVSASEVRDCADAFAEAFSEVYRLLLEHRDLFARAVEKAFGDCRLRYLHNPTMLYTQVLGTLHSAQASSSDALSLLLAMRIGLNSDAPALVAAEVESILAQDVPYFTVDPLQKAVFHGDTDTAVGELVATPMELVLDKVRRMGDADLAAQVRLIRSAFCATVPDETITPLNATVPAMHASSNTSLEGLAQRIGFDLVDRMVVDRFEHLPGTWLGPLAAIESERPWPPGVLGYDLYTGRLGVGLALARAGRALGEPGLIRAAESIFERSVEILTDATYEVRNLAVLGQGAYTGLTGVLWAVWAAGSVLERPEWCRAARAALPPLWDAALPAPRDKYLDVMSGVVGAWAVADALGADADVVAASRAEALECVRGGVWTELPVAAQSGFAHGTAGLAFQLAQHGGAVTGADLAPLVARLRCFRAQDEVNWYTNQRHGRVAHGWCHGRAGVTLGLGAAALVRGSSVDRAELREAISDIAGDSGYNLTHCHGDIGNMDVLRWLAAHGYAEAEEGIGRLVEVLTADVLAAKVADLHSRYALNDGLMVGVAGVLLHLADRIDTSVAVLPTTLEVWT